MHSLCLIGIFIFIFSQFLNACLSKEILGYQARAWWQNYLVSARACQNISLMSAMRSTVLIFHIIFTCFFTILLQKKCDYYNNASINEISFVLSPPFRGMLNEAIFIVIYWYDDYDNLRWIVIVLYIKIHWHFVGIMGNKWHTETGKNQNIH